jgi:hypothetical protein
VTLALVVTERVPLRAPIATGVNVTSIVQVAPAASVAGPTGHADVKAKSPLVAMRPIVIGAELLFVTVTVCAGLVVVTVMGAKLRLAGESSGGRPSPLTSTNNVPKSVAMATTPDCAAPWATGANFTAIEQLAAIASVEGQEWVTT